jgi:hypothetical protein
VKSVLRVYSIEVAAEKKEDLNEEPIIKRLRKVRTSVSTSSFLKEASLLITTFDLFRLGVRATMASDLYSDFHV